VCRVTSGAHIEHTSCQKEKTFSLFLLLWTIPSSYVLWFRCYKCL
jgi:hypothetical protein